MSTISKKKKNWLDATFCYGVESQFEIYIPSLNLKVKEKEKLYLREI